MDKNINKNILNIFTKNINNKFKLVPFNLYINRTGKFKYFPAVFKEWKNDVYFFNNKFITNFPIYDLNISKIIKSYFNLYFQKKFVIKKNLEGKLKRISINKIYVSKPELSHTNHKVIVTIYIFNREILIFQRFWKIKILKLFQNFQNIFFKLLNIYMVLEKISLITKPNKKKWILNQIKKIKQNIYLSRAYRKYKLYFDLNKYRFQDIFLYKLGKLISKFFNKKIEFNIIKLRYMGFHTDLFTEFLSLNLKKRKFRLMKSLNIVLDRIKLPKEKIKKGQWPKKIYFNLLENKYKNLNINSFINKRNLSEDLEIFYKNFKEKGENLKKKDSKFSNWDLIPYKIFINIFLKKIEYYSNILLSENNLKSKIFNRIKYKNLRGIKLEIKGRLTKRNRADRAVRKKLLKGGLKNIDSSFKGLSTVRFRGYANSNLEYSIKTSKRRVGAFAIKGWIIGGK